jgi:hypothetical protein
VQELIGCEPDLCYGCLSGEVKGLGGFNKVILVDLRISIFLIADLIDSY